MRTITVFSAIAIATLAWVPPATFGLGHEGCALAQNVSASSQFKLAGVRPEALSWLWDNADEALLKAANTDYAAFAWAQAPATPEHLGYSSGARYRATVVLDGVRRSVDVAYLDPATMAGRVASDNALGAKPYSFVAQGVSIEGKPPFTLLIQYTPVGSTLSDSQITIQASGAADASLAQVYVNHVRKTLIGLQPTLMKALNDRYFNAVLKKRGSYAIGPVDSKLNVKLTIVQEIKGIDCQMLSWWWDHIGDTARYRLWQPIDHVSFEWTIPPNSPDLHYDVGAVQKAKEYIGKTALTLNITGADPAVTTPPAASDGNPYFFATTNLTLLAKVLPDNGLIHQWKPNATGDGVILTSTFVNTALAQVLNLTFFQDLGSHALREFQMLPYFLPRLYKREYLHQ